MSGRIYIEGNISEQQEKMCILLPFLAKLVQPVVVHIKWTLSWNWWITDSIYRLMLSSDSKLCKTSGNGVRKSWVCLAISLCGDKQFAARHIGKLSYYRLCGTKPSNVLAVFKLWVTRLQLHTYIYEWLSCYVVNSRKRLYEYSAQYEPFEQGFMVNHVSA